MIRYRPRYIKATRNKRKILIVCCGEQTEQNYFKSFKEDLDIDLDIKFFGVNPKSLIEKTIDIKNKKEDEKNPYIMTWCVFDIDEFTREDFNRAYDLAVKNKIEVAYSNKCFELWFLLHFSYVQSAMLVKDYIKRLDTLLCRKYKKNDKGIYSLLKNKQKIAIKNAKKLLEYQKNKKLYDRNPSTTVYKLVERLNEYKK